jgi:DNA mismatch repair ATPase MutS
MITHRLFPKGEQLHALLSSNVNPNILIPVKGLVKEIKFDDINPQYLIKITHFYDTMKYLEKYFFNMRFSNGIGKKPRHLKLDFKDFKDTSELLERMNQLDEKNFYVVVDSIMCTKFMGDMAILFNKLQDHLIEIKLREIREMSIRAFYKGRYEVDSYGNFNIRLRKFIGDKIEAANIPWEKYIKML